MPLPPALMLILSLLLYPALHRGVLGSERHRDTEPSWVGLLSSGSEVWHCPGFLCNMIWVRIHQRAVVFETDQPFMFSLHALEKLLTLRFCAKRHKSSRGNPMKNVWLLFCCLFVGSRETLFSLCCFIPKGDLLYFLG